MDEIVPGWEDIAGDVVVYVAWICVLWVELSVPLNFIALWQSLVFATHRGVFL